MHFATLKNIFKRFGGLENHNSTFFFFHAEHAFQAKPRILKPECIAYAQLLISEMHQFFYKLQQQQPIKPIHGSIMLTFNFLVRETVDGFMMQFQKSNNTMFLMTLIASIPWSFHSYKAHYEVKNTSF